MRYLHGDVQQGRLSQLQPFSVYQVLPRLVYDSLFPAFLSVKFTPYHIARSSNKNLLKVAKDIP